MAANVLVAYYSMSGNTRRIAEEIGSALHADLEEIREPHPRRGPVGALRALADAVLRRKPPIDPVGCDPAGYDLLVLGGPVWGGRIASPVRTYAQRHGARATQVAFFCTEAGRGSERAFADMEHLCRRAPKATFVVDAKHLAPATHRAELGHFASRTGQSLHAAPG